MFHLIDLLRAFNLLFLLLTVPVVAAQSVTFQASVDRQKLGLDDMLTLTLTVETSGKEAIPTPGLPTLSDWALMGSTSSSSTSISIVGGRMVSRVSKTFKYTLSPRRTGNLTIPSISINIGGKVYTTEPITVEVVSGSLYGGGAGRTPRGRTTPAPSQPAPSGISGKNIFLSAYANKKKVYVGERVDVEFSVYTRLNIEHLSLVEEPSFSGFWKEVTFTAKELNYTTKQVGGSRYSAAVLTKYALWPVSPGKKTIGPMSVDCIVSTPPRSFFDLWGRREQTRLSSKPIQIEVLPLPERGRPPDFKGAVGKFNISWSIDKDTLRSNEAFTLRIHIKGKGNFHMIDEPTVSFPSTFEQYESRSISKSGRKDFEYVVMPRIDGEFIIPPVRLPYFDPRLKRYVVAKTDTIVLNVLKGEGANIASLPLIGGTKEAVEFVGKDIAYLRPDKLSLRMGSWVYPHFWWLLIFPFEALFLLVVFLIKRRSELLEANPLLARSLRAYKKARNELDRAKHIQQTGGFYSAIYSALFNFIADKLALPRSALPDDLFAELLERKFEPAFIDELKTFLSHLDYARFAPSGEKQESPQDTLRKAKKYLKILARRLK